MKDLDQPSRASLRKYGVRFGAYHIYLPALLKPAARALASLLWAQKHDNIDLSALSGAQHLAGSGRTSFPVDKLLDRDAYRMLGYRQCGERAVRVDILERLADLIRPALSWREASPGEKPAGAFDGRGFVVTQAMTSLTGSAGEDFASILRALGYRMEKKPPLPPKPAVVEAPVAEETAPAPAPAAASELAAEGNLETAADIAEAASAEAPVVAAADGEAAPTTSSDAPPNSEDVPAAASATLLPDVAFSPATPADEPAAEAEAVEAEIVEAASVDVQPNEAPAAEAPQPQAADEAAPETVVAADGSVPEIATPEAVAAPEMVEVWRPGGRSDERRPRHDRSRQRQHARPQQGEQAAAATGEAGEAAKGERHRRGRRNEFRKPRTDAPAEGVTAAAPAEGAPPREDRGGRPPRERFAGKGRDGDKARDNDRPRGDRPGDKGKFAGGGRDKGKFGGGRDKGGGRDRDKGGRESGPSHRQWATSAAPAPRERDRPVDPNSPFAKLAALKEQLTARKD